MNVKKILALVLAAMMVFGMTSAMADTTTAADADGATISQGNNVLVLKKAFVVKDADYPNYTIAYPAVNYTYSIAPATAAEVSGASVTGNALDESTNPWSEDTSKTVTVAVQQGKDNGATITNPTINAGYATLNAQGYQAVTGDITVTINAANHVAPGIYRYKITDTTPDANLTNVGIVRPVDDPSTTGTTEGVDKEFFLDVYIGWNSEATPALEVKGFVLTKNNTTTINTSTNKESGIEELTLDTNYQIADGTTVDETKNDVYYAYNVSLKKIVSGTMGDTAHEFTFSATVTNETKNSQALKYIQNETDITTQPTNANTQGTNSGATSFTLSHNDEILFIGLNPWATVTYTETNDTETTYTVTAKNGTASANTVITLADGTATFSSGTATAAHNQTVITYSTPQQVSDYSASDWAEEANYTVAKFTEYKNEVDAISPTGVVLRFAPYFAMFAAGCVLFLIFATKRSKKEEE